MRRRDFVTCLGVAFAWPVCGRRAGLTKSNGKADRYATPATNPGVTATAGAAAPIVKKKAVAVQPAVVTAPSGKTIKVERGDTLRKIATRYHVIGGWKGLLGSKTLKNPNVTRRAGAQDQQTYWRGWVPAPRTPTRGGPADRICRASAARLDGERSR